MLQQVRSRGVALGLASLLSVSLSAPAWSAPVSQASETTAAFQLAQQSQSKTIAVVDFENHTGDSSKDNYKRGIAESLMTKLAQRSELTIVERGQLDKAIKELGFGQSVYADAGQAKEIGKMINADYIVTGDIVKAGSRYEINARLIEVETAKVVVSESQLFENENDILVVVDYLGLQFSRRLGLYVSERELEMVRSRLRGQQSAQAAGDNSWIFWTIGGVVVVGAVVAVVAVLASPRQNITQCVGSCTPTSFNNLSNAQNAADDMNLSMPLLRF